MRNKTIKETDARIAKAYAVAFDCVEVAILDLVNIKREALSFLASTPGADDKALESFMRSIVGKYSAATPARVREIAKFSISYGGAKVGKFTVA